MTLKSDFDAALKDLGTQSAAHLTASGREIAGELEASVQLLVDWLDFIETGRLTQHASELIDGVRGTLIELIAALSLGLSRASLSLIRSEIDMTLSWLYYKDHPQEWSHLNAAGTKFMQHGDLLQYFVIYANGFKRRFAVLRPENESHPEPFKILSKYIHCQQREAMPPIRALEQCVSTAECREVVALQKQTTAYLNDILLAYYGDDYTTLPAAATRDLKPRLGDKRFAEFRKIS